MVMQSKMRPFLQKKMIAFFHLVLIWAAVVVAQQVSDVEMKALSSLLNSTNGDKWLWRDEQEAGAVWNFTVDGAGNFISNPCSSSAVTNQTWQGITCSQTPQACSSLICHITGIILTSYELSGSIPPEIGNFPFLEVLKLDVNELTGSIPREMGNLTTLTYLTLYSNTIRGVIPHELGQLQAVSYVDLDENLFTGTIPISLCNLTALVTLYIGESSVTGTIPSEIGRLTALQLLALNTNQLTGTIPDEMKTLSALTKLDLDGNQFNGSIPNVVWELTTLRSLRLHGNQLTRTIPTEVGKLKALRVLTFHENQLTGTIPTEVGLLTSLRLLYLHRNLLTGTIPSTVGQLEALRNFALHENQLTGSIPSEIGQLTSLRLLYLNENQLTGTIPSTVGDLMGLQLLGLFNNSLTGTVPSILGQVTTLKNIYLNNNQLSGTIPSTIGLLVNMIELWMHDNHLGGRLPTEMSKAHELRTLFLQNNLLTGDLNGVFNHSAQLELTAIDISNNRLTGSLTGELFRLPQLKVLSLSVNCFENKLSENLCDAKQAEVLSLNGLQAADSCADKVVVPLSGVLLFNTIGGNVPSCVWALRNLTVLHLTGNGLQGSLVQSLPTYSKLADLSLSQNKMDGTIPADILSIGKVDLSNNRFSGEYQDGGHYVSDSTINVTINRLSGNLPVSELQYVTTGSLDILRGNMFSCDTVPKNDKSTNNYICGSQNLNEALYMFITVFGLAMMLVVVGLSARFAVSTKKHQFMAHLQARGALLWTYLTFVQNLDTSHFHMNSPAVGKIMKLSRSFKKVMLYAIRLLCVILVGCVILYLVKELDTSHSYATHDHRYSWFWTMAYMSGVVPAGLWVMVWALAISAMCYRILIFFKSEQSPTSTPVPNQDIEEFRFRDHAVPIVTAFIFNACVNITVNTLYIYSTQQGLGALLHFYVQLSVSSFRLLYTAVALPLLSRPIHNLIENVRFRFLLLMINDLLLPCLVTALTSDACFQGLLTPAHAVSTQYSFNTCVTYTTLDGITYCSRYRSIEVDSAALVPPFIYNNQCASVIMTSYIPVFLLGFAMQLLLPFITLSVLTYIPYGKMKPLFREIFHGIIWPHFWQLGGDVALQNKSILKADASILLDTRTIFCNDVMNNMLLMMTFGLCSPVLALAIACAVILKMAFWMLLIGRFARSFFRKEKEKENVEAAVTVAPTPNSITASDTTNPMSSAASAGDSCTTGDSRAVTMACTSSKDTDVTITTSSRDSTAELLVRQSRISHAIESKTGIHFSLMALAEMQIPLLRVLEGSFWHIAWCSALFIALMSWDMATDEVGWLKSIWILVIPYGHVIVLRILSYYYHRDVRRNAIVEKESKDAASVQHDLETDSSSAQRSPLHFNVL